MTGGADRTPPGPDAGALSRRKIAVIEHLAHGLSIRETARAMGIGRSTVRSHVEEAGALLGTRGTAATVAAAANAGLLAPAPAAVLDPAERSVLELLRLGHDEKAIASALERPRAEIHRTVDGLYRLFNVRTHAALAYRGTAPASPDPGGKR